MIQTRVCIDDMLGPFDCQADADERWNGKVSPHFALDVTRELSAQTLRMADECGYESVETIHVIEGRADSRDTVHLIESDMMRVLNEWGDREPIALAVRVPWRSLDRGATATLGSPTPAARKAARKSKVTGRGAARAVVVHVRWQWMADESDTAANVVQPDENGLYPIGGWEWCWDFASWWCVCGERSDWHETECALCGMNRDKNPKTPLAVATWAAGTTLRRLAPEATSALVDLTGPPFLVAVFAGDTEIDTADDTGPFDTETLGQADAILRKGMEDSGPGDVADDGWEHVPDEKSAQLYRISFPDPRP